MKPTAKHNDEELREAMASLEWAMANDNSLTQHQKECLRTVLASLESARADTRRYQWLIENEACVVESLDEDVSESERYEVHLERLLGPVATGESPDAAIDRAATSAEGEA